MHKTVIQKKPDHNEIVQENRHKAKSCQRTLTRKFCLKQKKEKGWLA
jgi:hypothetical protein